MIRNFLAALVLISSSLSLASHHEAAAPSEILKHHKLRLFQVVLLSTNGLASTQDISPLLRGKLAKDTRDLIQNLRSQLKTKGSVRDNDDNHLAQFVTAGAIGATGLGLYAINVGRVRYLRYSTAGSSLSDTNSYDASMESGALGNSHGTAKALADIMVYLKEKLPAEHFKEVDKTAAVELSNEYLMRGSQSLVRGVGGGALFVAAVWGTHYLFDYLDGRLNEVKFSAEEAELFLRDLDVLEKKLGLASMEPEEPSERPNSAPGVEEASSSKP